MNNGPVEAAFTVFDDFPNYKSGLVPTKMCINAQKVPNSTKKCIFCTTKNKVLALKCTNLILLLKTFKCSLGVSQWNSRQNFKER